MRCARGQASIEYLALWALVAIVLGAAAALTAGGLGRQVLYGIQRGLCAVVGGPCPGPPPDVADLPPCPLHRSSRTQDFQVSFAVVKLGGGLSVLEERSSDGSVSVTFADTANAGGTTGVGAHFRLGPAKVGAEATAGVGVDFTTGRAWHFPSQTAADAFVRHFGSDQTLPGRVGNDLRRVCGLCHLVGWEPDRPPPPDDTYLQGGGHAEAQASAGLGLQAEGRGHLAEVLGRRRRRNGETTWYVRVDGDVSARFFVGLGLGAVAGGSAIGEYTVDAGGHPLKLVVRLVRRHFTESSRPHIERSLFSPPRVVPEPFHGAGGVEEAETALDLTDPGNGAAVHGFLGASSHGRVGQLGRRVDDVLARVRDHGTATLRTFGLRDRHGGVDGSVAFGVVAGAGYAHAAQQLDLTGVYERLPGLSFLPRADCLPL